MCTIDLGGDPPPLAAGLPMLLLPLPRLALLTAREIGGDENDPRGDESSPLPATSAAAVAKLASSTPRNFVASFSVMCCMKLRLTV